MERLIIKVSTNGKKEKSQRISVDDISTYRPWLDENNKATGTFVVLKGSGKSFTCDFSAEELDKLMEIKEL